MINCINNFVPSDNTKLSDCLNLEIDELSLDNIGSELDIIANPKNKENGSSEDETSSSDKIIPSPNEISNSSKNDELEITKIKQPKEYKELWKEKYKCEEPIGSVKGEIIHKIKTYLNDCGNARTKVNKTKVAIELINYLAEDGYKLLYHCSQFKKTVKAKILELSYYPDFVNHLSPSADEFAYALTGKCF